MNLFKNGYLQMYQKLSGSDLKGDIPNRYLLELLYAMLCVDDISARRNVAMPDVALPVVARELLELYQTIRDNYINNEDYGYLSMEILADAFILYLRDTQTDIKDVHSMSRYDLACDVIRFVENLEE